MLKAINYCYQNKKIASFYCNQADSEIHLTGYVEKFNESEILIAHISANGYYDGFILIHTDDIYRIDYDGDYEKKIEKLYHLKKQSHQPIDTFTQGEDEILYSLLDYAKNNGHIISLYFEDSCLSGLVDSYDDNIIYLSVISDYGIKNGISIVNVDEVSMVCVDTDDEQDLKILYRDNLK